MESSSPHSTLSLSLAYVSLIITGMWEFALIPRQKAGALFFFFFFFVFRRNWSVPNELTRLISAGEKSETKNRNGTPFEDEWRVLLMFAS